MRNREIERDKAIEIISQYLSDHPLSIVGDLRDALRLAISALVMQRETERWTKPGPKGTH